MLLFFCLIFSSTQLHAQDFALERLEQSPRHHEWVDVVYDGRTVHSFVAWPESPDNTMAVIVIHENRGLTDWVRSFADQVAEAGYIAIAPDLLSGFDSRHRRTSDFESSDAARDALYQLDPDRITADLHAVRDHIAGLAAASGNIVVAGFCWGGSQTFRFATNSDDIAAALVFYGSAPEDEQALARIRVPVYGFYAGNDQRINATIPATEQVLEREGISFEYEIYPGAGHAYMRSGDDPDGSPENRRARDVSWDRLKQLLTQLAEN